MHSSLSGMSNQQLGKSVGVDEYVAKFEPQRLSEALTRRILGESGESASSCLIDILRRSLSMDMSEKTNLLESVDARTRLAGSNKMEILLFSLGTRETFRDQRVQGA